MNNSDQPDIESMLMGVEFPNLLPPDGEDDEAMVEYAIALSLQQQEQQDQQAQRHPTAGAVSGIYSCLFSKAHISLIEWIEHLLLKR